MDVHARRIRSDRGMLIFGGGGGSCSLAWVGRVLLSRRRLLCCWVRVVSGVADIPGCWCRPRVDFRKRAPPVVWITTAMLLPILPCVVYGSRELWLDVFALNGEVPRAAQVLGTNLEILEELSCCLTSATRGGIGLSQPEDYDDQF
ncbi:unnamed protein product [Scytosiphon promiscuus]